MSEKTNYIVQYVGFKTDWTENEFITRWIPFATGFKNSGIRTIDLYKIIGNDNLTFISRNVWEEKTYFRIFPYGIAGEGSGGGTKVTQFGGYWLAKEHLDRKDKMILVFLTKELSMTDPNQISRLWCSENTPYRQMLELVATSPTNFQLQLICEYLKQM